MTTPLQQYQADVNSGKLLPDAAQAAAVDALERLYHQLVALQTQKNSIWSRFKYLFSDVKNQAPLGLYFWGGVGRGKTYLMDLFYSQLPFDEKMRVHFHRFMHQVHSELEALKQQSDPLLVIADKLAAKTKIICFDEFFVSDITDAMILGGLFEALFARDVVLVATSNIEPENLYKNGLQRARFLPAIKLIQARCEVINVDAGKDYRLRQLTGADIYHCPQTAEIREQLENAFLQMSVGEVSNHTFVEVNNRKIEALKIAQDLVWFEYSDLCEGPRSQNDYIELSQCFHTVFLTGVKQMGEKNDDAARRFIALVDEFYERHVNLIIAAEVPLAELYSHGRLTFEFQRCLSRLQEMQSKEYLAKPHLS
ncbi:cell division protein ZapE [Gayadomonas joobiniege]|uniref:cell division protein ZapE n=1 Tax=Gayadomonas joobiniege TaxID=1234606 RepID=UPI000370BEBC|nr:cell division protein ZapE [Gayadomonas joobiniege]